MKKPEGFMLYFDRLDIMRDLSNEETGAIFKAIWEYAESGVIPDLPKNIFPYWKILRGCIDRNIASYNENCIGNRYNRYKGTCKNSNTTPLDIWVWWADQPDYTPEIFKKAEWYEDAAAIYQQKHPTAVNDCQQPSTAVTNTNPSSSTISNNNTIPSHNTHSLGGVEPFNSSNQELDDDNKRREEWGKVFKQKAEELKKESASSK